MYDRVYQSKPSSTSQTQNIEQAEKKGMYLPSQSFDPFRNDNSSQSNVAPAQMMEDDQKKKKYPQVKMDGVQMKEKKKKQVQKKAVQRNSANSFGADFSSKGAMTSMPRPIQRNSANSFGADFSSKGATTAMPRPVQQKMENSFGADFSNVLIHKDSGSATNMGALAYAQGNEVHFAPGQYNPETQKGQELLGHELTHVIQQRQGRVQATTQGKGMAINDDPALEREADAMGAKAARSDYPIQQKSVHENGPTSSKYTDGLNGQERDKKIKGSRSAQQNGWFDKQGEQLFDHWRTGNGAELVLNSEEWSVYMKAHAGLSAATEREISSKLPSTSGDFSGTMKFNFGGGYRTGYQLLGGSNADVGGLQFSGHVEYFDTKDGRELQLNYSLVWNDIMDPDSSFGDRLGVKLFPGTPYTVRVRWNNSATWFQYKD